jgi:hypothetical protein
MGPGLSARIAPVRAVEGEPMVVLVEVDDAAGAVGAVGVEVRTATGAWVRASAVQEAVLGRWRADVPARHVPPAGQAIAVRAMVLGARGGLLLDIGHDDPLTVTVSSAERAAVEDRVLRQASTQTHGGPLDRLVAYVGAEGRAGTGARVRVLLAVGIALTERQEVTLGVTVGPAFSRPAALSEGGAIVLGVEAGWRAFTQAPRFASFAPYLEVALASDLRLPGVDPSAALRVGLSADLGLDTRIDLSIGGGPVIWSATESADLGFAGGGRLALRFGGVGPAEP